MASNSTGDHSACDTPFFTIEAADGRCFRVQKRILDTIKSDAMEALTNQLWKEGHESKTTWHDRDAGTVSRFVEWLCNHDYHYLPPEIARTDTGMDPDMYWSYFRQAAASSVLVHVRLYLLATYYEISALEQLTITRTREALGYLHLLVTGVNGPKFLVCNYLPYKVSRVELLAEVARYVYDNTPERPDDKEPMRDLVSKAVADVLGIFVKERAGQELVKENGELSVDIFKKAAKIIDRLSAVNARSNAGGGCL